MVSLQVSAAPTLTVPSPPIPALSTSTTTDTSLLESAAPTLPVPRTPSPSRSTPTSTLRQGSVTPTPSAPTTSLSKSTPVPASLQESATPSPPRPALPTHSPSKSTPTPLTISESAMPAKLVPLAPAVPASEPQAVKKTHPVITPVGKPGLESELKLQQDISAQERSRTIPVDKPSLQASESDLITIKTPPDSERLGGQSVFTGTDKLAEYLGHRRPTSDHEITGSSQPVDKILNVAAASTRKKTDIDMMDVSKSKVEDKDVSIDETAAYEDSNAFAEVELPAAAPADGVAALAETSAIEATIASVLTPATEETVGSGGTAGSKAVAAAAAVQDAAASRELHEGEHGALIYKILTALKLRFDSTDENLIVGRVIAR
jgi:hypothetical protein